jgi:uncharacterized protein YbjT (DUF2867 family)
MEDIGALNVVMMGATGAVGGHALQQLMQMDQVKKITTLGRHIVQAEDSEQLHQYKIDILNPSSYENYIGEHEVAICTLGVGQPSKVSQADFLRIDKQAVLDFASACKRSGVSHFELLSSVGASAKSSSFYLRSKGELINELKALDFDRLSIFQPSMILTPTNRYGKMHGIMLTIWPYLNPLLIGSLRKYRGILVEILGQSMAKNMAWAGEKIEYLHWDDFRHTIKK